MFGGGIPVWEGHGRRDPKSGPLVGEVWVVPDSWMRIFLRRPKAQIRCWFTCSVALGLYSGTYQSCIWVAELQFCEVSKTWWDGWELQGTFSTVAFLGCLGCFTWWQWGKKGGKTSTRCCCIPYQLWIMWIFLCQKLVKTVFILTGRLSRKKRRFKKRSRLATSMEFQVKTTLGHTERTDFLFWEVVFLWCLSDFWKSWETPPQVLCIFFLIPKIRGMSLQNFEKSIEILQKACQSDLVNPINSFPKKNHFKGLS